MKTLHGLTEQEARTHIDRRKMELAYKDFNKYGEFGIHMKKSREKAIQSFEKEVNEFFNVA